MPPARCVKCQEELTKESARAFEFIHRCKGNDDGDGVHLMCIECYGIFHAEGRCDVCLTCPECGDEVVGHQFIDSTTTKDGDSNREPVYFRTNAVGDRPNKRQVAGGTAEARIKENWKHSHKDDHSSYNNGEVATYQYSATSEDRGRNKLAKLRGEALPGSKAPTPGAEVVAPSATFSTPLEDRGRNKLAKLRGEALPGSGAPTPGAEVVAPSAAISPSSEDRGRNKLAKLRGNDPPRSSTAEEVDDTDVERGSTEMASSSSDRAFAVRNSDRGRQKLAKLRGDSIPRSEANVESNITNGSPGVLPGPSNDSSDPDCGIPSPSLPPTTLVQEDAPALEPNDNAHLVEAVLVTDKTRRKIDQENSDDGEGPESNTLIFEAREVGCSDYARDWRLRSLCILISAGFAVVILVVVVMLSKESSNSMIPFTLIPGIEKLPYTIISLQDTSSPQSKAHQWVTNHPKYDILPDHRKLQLFALATFANANMADPSSFLVETLEECNWEFEAECDDTNSVTSIPSTLGQLTKLTSLSLLDNQLFGNIPTELGLLTDLQEFFLNTNLLSGSVPIQFKNLQNLQMMHLYDNDLTDVNFIDITQSLPLTDIQSYSLERLQPSAAPSQAPSQSPSQAPTTTREVAMRGELAGVFGDVVNEPSTPHEQALHWILHVDPMQLDELSENLVQRYTLALFYYQTSDGNSWRSCNPPAEGEDYSCTYIDMYRHDDGSVSYTPRNETSVRWLSEKHECEWAEILCKPETDGTVIGIDIFGQNLTGTLPEELINLDDLMWLSLSFNKFYGTIPEVYGEFQHMTTLEITESFLTGQIPGGFFRQPNLLNLNLAFNMFTGTIPPEIGYLTTLQYLFFFNTEISGTLPTQIGRLEAVKNLWLWDNNGLTGPIPSEIGELHQLENLRVTNNGHSGPIPSEMGLLTNLDMLLMAGSDMGGSTIPEEFWNMSAQFIDIDNAGIGGTISRNIGRMTNMQGLKASRNFFTGTLPSEIGLLDDLLLLWIHVNPYLGGEVPFEICRLRGPENLMFLNADCAGSVPRINCTLGCCTGCCDEYGQCQVL